MPGRTGQEAHPARRPRDRTADRRSAQDAPAEDLPDRAVGFARRAHGALLRKRTVNNRTSGQSPGFLRAARKAAARSARMPGPGNGSGPGAQDGRRHGRQGTIPRRRRARCRMASPDKHGGRRRQQQATAGTVTGETRNNRTGNGYCPCLRDKHSPHRTQGSGPKSTRRDNAPDPCRKAGSFPGQDGPSPSSSGPRQTKLTQPPPPSEHSDPGAFRVCAFVRFGQRLAREAVGVVAVALRRSP